MFEIKVTVDVPALDRLVDALGTSLVAAATHPKGDGPQETKATPETAETAEEKPKPKPRKKRRTKAEIEAEKQAKAEAEKEQEGVKSDDELGETVSDGDDGSDDDIDTSDGADVAQDDTDDVSDDADGSDDGEGRFEIKDVQQKLIDLAAAKGRAESKKILEKLGASTLLKLDRDKYAEAIKLVDEAME